MALPTLSCRIDLTPGTVYQMYGGLLDPNDNPISIANFPIHGIVFQPIGGQVRFVTDNTYPTDPTEYPLVLENEYHELKNINFRNLKFVADPASPATTVLIELNGSRKELSSEVGDGGSLPGNVAYVDASQEFTQQQNFNATALVDAANIAWDVDDNQVTTVTLAGNRVLDNPTNMRDGSTYILIVKQDATGGRTLAFGSAYKWSGGIVPSLSAGANAIDILTFVCDGTNMFGVPSLDFQ